MGYPAFSNPLQDYFTLTMKSFKRLIDNGYNSLNQFDAYFMRFMPIKLNKAGIRYLSNPNGYTILVPCKACENILKSFASNHTFISGTLPVKIRGLVSADSEERELGDENPWWYLEFDIVVQQDRNFDPAHFKKIIELTLNQIQNEIDYLNVELGGSVTLMRRELQNILDSKKSNSPECEQIFKELGIKPSLKPAWRSWSDISGIQLPKEDDVKC